MPRHGQSVFCRDKASMAKRANPRGNLRSLAAEIDAYIPPVLQNSEARRGFPREQGLSR
jgi:hypothetical protein